jgi:hypothetical protein
METFDSNNKEMTVAGTSMTKKVRNRMKEVAKTGLHFFFSISLNTKGRVIT